MLTPQQSKSDPKTTGENETTTPLLCLPISPGKLKGDPRSVDSLGVKNQVASRLVHIVLRRRRERRVALSLRAVDRRSPFWLVRRPHPVCPRRAQAEVSARLASLHLSTKKLQANWVSRDAQAQAGFARVTAGRSRKPRNASVDVGLSGYAHGKAL